LISWKPVEKQPRNCTITDTKRKSLRLKKYLRESLEI
jgi:hypothetical protein